jgi:transposase
LFEGNISRSIVTLSLALRSSGDAARGFRRGRAITWPRQARTVEKTGACFTPVRIDAADAGAEDTKLLPEDDRRVRAEPVSRLGLIEIELGNRRRIRVDAQVDPDALARVLDVLERR